MMGVPKKTDTEKAPTMTRHETIERKLAMEHSIRMSKLKARNAAQAAAAEAAYLAQYTPGVRVTVYREDGASFTGTVVKLDPDFYDTLPAHGELAIATAGATWPCIVDADDCTIED